MRGLKQAFEALRRPVFSGTGFSGTGSWNLCYLGKSDNTVESGALGFNILVVSSIIGPNL